MVSNVNYSSNSYGNIQKIGQMQNGRTVYRIIDSQGVEAGKITLPSEDSDKFETAYKDIMETAPKIQEFSINNSSEKDIKRRRNISRAITTVGGIAGVALPLYLTRKSTSTIKKIISTVAGIITGLSAGFLTSLAVTTPPGTFKFIKATRTLSKLDVKAIPTEHR